MPIWVKEIHWFLQGNLNARNNTHNRSLTAIYEKQNGSKPNLVACHTGLECGILGTNYTKMDMISFGPTIHGAHSPDERASISSAQK